MATYLQAFMPILAPYINDFLEEVKKQTSYLCCYHCNVETLSEEIPRLDVERATLQQIVDAAERKLDDIRPDVEDWLKRASATKTRAGSVFTEAEDVRKHSLSKWCPILHYSLSREAKKTTKASVELRQVKFDTVSNPSNPQDRLILPASSDQFKSRELIEKEIMEALMDDTVYLIVLCGMGGIGKTTMAKNIRIKAKMTSMFEIVVFAVVSQSPDLIEVQKQIAEGIGLPLEEHGLQTRADKLNSRLMEAKSFLIILDDVWKEIDLENIGIPSKSNHQRGKILTTSRVQDALTEGARIVRMDVLTEDEAWDLFRDKSGYSNDGPIQCEIAKQIAKECKGLPLALVALASALRNKSEKAWKDALRQLERNLVPTNAPEVLQKLYVPLKLSYDQLQSEEARYIFLLCSLFPEDYEIPVEMLLRYGWGLRTFSGIENLSEARDRIDTLVERLKFRFLLVDTERGNRNYVKMHDVVRDVALSIASKDRYSFLVNDERNQWPTRDSYENYTHISVELKEKSAFPENMICPSLEFLRFIPHWGGVKLPENFFAGMGSLKVLTVFELVSFPSSTCQLTTLRVLHLRSGWMKPELKDEMASIIGKLVNLEIFSLGDFQFSELPRDLGHLKRLRSLELVDCWGPSTIAPGIISGLDQLEELALFECSFGEWEAEEQEKRNASFAEVASLKNLETLKVNIGNTKLLSFDSPNVPKLGTFHVQIGEWDMRTEKIREKYNKVIICACEEATRLGNFFLPMIRNVEFLGLKGDGCIEILNELAAEGFQVVKAFNLLECNNIEYLVHEFQIGIQNIVSFAALETLYLGYSQSLKGISCLGQPPIGTFRSLKQLMLDHLPEFKRPFPLSIIEGLLELEDLFVINCPFEEVFKDEDMVASHKIKFPILRNLILHELPNLEVFCKGIDNIEFPALEALQISDLPKMTNFCHTQWDGAQRFLFNKEVSCTSLKGIKLTSLNCPSEIFDSGNPIGNFSGLETLEVKSCLGFKSIFASPMFRGLTNLKEIVLEDCEELIEVIASIESQVGQTILKEAVFPKLEKLLLKKLPNVQRFCHMTCDIELPLLGTITIHDCPRLEAFSSGSLCSAADKFLFTKEVLCTNLERLELYGVNSATGIFSYTVPSENFRRLTILKVKSCRALKTIFSPSVFRGLANLEALTVKDCEELMEIIAPDESKEGLIKEVKETVFPKLRKLKLINLPKIDRFCHITHDLLLPSLEMVRIEDCPVMKTFSFGSLELPSLKAVHGMQDPIFATKFFFNKKKSTEEINMDKSFFRLSLEDISVREEGNTKWNKYLVLSDSSDSFDLVAELENGKRIQVDGTFSMANLAPGYAYEVLYILRLGKYAEGWAIPVNFQLTLPEGITYNRTQVLNDNPREKWLEILVGEFTVEANQVQDGELKFCLLREDLYLKSRLSIRSVIIRQKLK